MYHPNDIRDASVIHCPTPCTNTRTCNMKSCVVIQNVTLQVVYMQAAGLTWLVPLCCVGGNRLGYRGLWHGCWGWGGGRRSLGGLRALRGHGRSGQRITLAHSCCQGGVCSHDGCSGSSPCSGGSISLYSKGLLNCISLRYGMTVYVYQDRKSWLWKLWKKIDFIS